MNAHNAPAPTPVDEPSSGWTRPQTERVALFNPGWLSRLDQHLASTPRPEWLRALMISRPKRHGLLRVPSQTSMAQAAAGTQRRIPNDAPPAKNPCAQTPRLDGTRLFERPLNRLLKAQSSLPAYALPHHRSARSQSTWPSSGYHPPNPDQAVHATVADMLFVALCSR